MASDLCSLAGLTLERLIIYRSTYVSKSLAREKKFEGIFIAGLNKKSAAMNHLNLCSVTIIAVLINIFV